MAFLKRGNVRIPHKDSTRILLHRIDGSPVHLKINDINCWEEHSLAGSLRTYVSVHYGLSSVVVQESFGFIDGIVNAERQVHHE